MSTPNTPPSPPQKTHHHDTFSYRGWLVSDHRHRRAIAAAFYTFVVPTLLVLALFALMHLIVALYFVGTVLLHACGQ